MPNRWMVSRSVPLEGPLFDAEKLRPRSVLLLDPEDADSLGELPELCLLVVVGPTPRRDHFLELGGDASPGALEHALQAANKHLELLEMTERYRSDLDESDDLERELVDIGVALAAERDLSQLLERILSSARNLLKADAGSLYLLEEGEGERTMRFVLAQNDSVEISYSEVVLPVDPSSIAGFVASKGRVLNIEDAYEISDSEPFSFNPTFDLSSGYRTRSLLVVPMRTRQGEIVGVLQLINRKRDRATKLSSAEVVDAEVIAFSADDRRLVEALAAQAAVAIESSMLLEDIRSLFESFVEASVTSIEQRDPTTSGHSFRVSDYTLSLAEILDGTPTGAWGGVTFSRDDLIQLRYAALLHDVGKVGVRESVLTKARKLYPFQELLVRERFEHARRSLQVIRATDMLRRLMDRSSPVSADDLEALQRELRAIDEDVDTSLEKVMLANLPTVLESEIASGLDELSKRTFCTYQGFDQPLVTEEELIMLRIPRGSLNPEERLEIESHVVHSYRFLRTLPWPKNLARIPEIAAKHHEKLNGRGYPHSLESQSIPVEVRMLTICDIFDALTAKDRPYKKALGTDRALSILQEDVKYGALDAELVDLFIDSKAYERVPSIGSSRGSKRE